MRIIVKNLEGEVIDTINTLPMSLARDVEKVKEKYPPSKFHADLETY